MEDEIHVSWKCLCDLAGPYPPEAYLFVQQGLRHTLDRIREHEPDLPEQGRHVSGQELCLGLRDFATDQFGRLARTVLTRWRIHSTADFGRIVFALVDIGLMRKTDQDSLDDFRGVYEFDEAFEGHEVG